MLPVKKSNFLAATLKREKTAERRERKRTEKDGKAERSGKTSGKKKIERGMERWRFKRTAMKRRGVRRGGKVNSVKYPQLDATHWHTVSMQILFTLGFPPPFVSLYLSLSFSPSRHRDSHRAPHRTLVLRSLLFLSPVTSRGKRSDARRTCAHPVCITHTPLAPSPISHLTTEPHRSALYANYVCLIRAFLRIIWLFLASTICSTLTRKLRRLLRLAGHRSR